MSESSSRLLATSPLAGAITAQFASRPQLVAVAGQHLATLISQTYPTLSIDLTRTRLLTPTSRGGWSRTPLLPSVIDYLANGTPLDFSDRHGRSCYLSDHPPTPLTLENAQPLDLQVIQELIQTLPQTLPVALQDALAAYWNEDSDQGISRWRWLGDVLRDTLHITTLQRNDLTQAEREMLSQLVDHPDRDQRIARFGESAVHAYLPQASFSAGPRAHYRLGTDLLLLCVVNHHTYTLRCSLAGPYERFEHMDDALQDWARRTEPYAVVERVAPQLLEPEGNLFDVQASTVLNRQLQQLGDLKLGTLFGLEALKSVYRHITDPWMSFLDAPMSTPPVLTTVRSQLPDWLTQATPAERASYRRHSLQLASAKKRSEGLTFLSDVPDIRTYTQTALTHQLHQDARRLGQATTEPIQPDDLQLTFHVAAGYPGGAGYVERVDMNLIDLAINNLQGQPKGTLTIAHRSGQTLPGWLNADYIHGSDGLIQRLDIGKTYPQMLKAQLLGATDPVREREQRFAEQTVAQLPLLALELSLRRANGVTALGAAYVSALMGQAAAQRQVAGESIVIRQLALLRKPHALADAVTHMYIIEPENGQGGPHLLYRPLYADMLHQFASREGLMEAIATPGELQTSVLTWLSDSARPIYDNGGFLQPHYVRFGVGDEFETPRIPAPATLAVDGASDELLQFLSSGRLMQYLYGANARALVDQAERTSVSNTESRWRVFLEGAGLIFNTLLLPLARGPFMLAGWLLNLMASARRDIPGLNSPDPVTRELAWVDMLMNVGMVMFELVPSRTRTPETLLPDLHWQIQHSQLERRDEGRWPPYLAPVIEPGPVLMDTPEPGLKNTALDFSFANARNQLTSSQQQRLWQFQAAKPDVLPSPVLSGSRRGLYNHLHDWYALLDGRWYQVQLLSEGGVVIVDPSDPHRQGPYLKSDDQGAWSLDLRLRLSGGMPLKRIAAVREHKAQRRQQLEADRERFMNPRQEIRQGVQVNINSGQQALQAKIDTAEQLMRLAAGDTKYTDSARANTRRNFDKALHEQTAAYQQLLDSREERHQLEIPLPPAVSAVLLENSVNNLRKSVVVADMDRQALYNDNPDLTVPYAEALPTIFANPTRYAQFLKDMSQINERQINALELKDRYLLELFNLGDPGLAGYNRLTQGRPDEISALAIKYSQLQNYKFLSQKHWQQGLFDNQLDATLEPLAPQLRTHSELNALNLSPSDRVEVLESLLEYYGKAVDSLQGMALVQGEYLEAEYFHRTQALVDSLYQDVVQQLASEVKPPSPPTRRPPKQLLPKPGRPQKKVIKTRRQGVLIGDLKPAGSDLPIDVVEVRSEHDDRLLGTYSQHETAWDEIQDARGPTKPVLPPGTRALSVVKGEARKLLAELDTIISREQRYAQVSRFPVEIEESLSYQAQRFDTLAGELERALQAQPKNQRVPADQALADNLRGAYTRLIAKGTALRIERSLALPPTDSHVEYLLAQDRIQIARLENRVPSRGERQDFIQEYAVNDKRGFPLWYAHFHYTEMATPKGEFNVAHLKTKAQRRETYYTLLAKAQNPKSVVDVHRGAISRALAERWFLPLAP